MDLVEDYLRAVAGLLPKGQREDITAELRDMVLSRIEARSAELGRPLTPDETEAVLRKIGHPLSVAAGFREGPRHAVGPVLYPYWEFAVKVALTLQAALALLVFLAHAASTGNVGQAFGQAIGSAVTSSLLLIGAATVVAWLVERRAVKIGYFDRWRVRDLRALEVAGWDADDLRAWAAPAGRKWARSREERLAARPASEASRAVFRIVAGAVLLLWWVGLMHFPVAATPGELAELGVEPGVLADVHWAGLRAALFWPVVAYCIALMAQAILQLMRPEKVWVQGLFDIALGGALVGGALWLWSASPLAPAVGVDSLGQLGRVLRDGLGRGAPYPLVALVTLALLLALLGGVRRVAAGLWKLSPRAARPRAAPQSSSMSS